MSIKKVAEMAGVSIATVSRYFNSPEQLKKTTLTKVENAINALNYQPNTLAQNFRRGKSGLIVVVVYNIGNPVYENFTHTITQTAQAKGYDVLIKETNYQNLSIDYYQDILSSKQADGLIIMVDLPKIDHKTREKLQNLPIVFIKSTPSSTELSPQFIHLDNHKAAETATNHLIHLGHKSIVCISTNTHYSSCKIRKAGFSDTIKAAGLEPIKTFTLPVYAKEQDINKVIKQLLRLKTKPTAIFCTNDDIAIDILCALKQQGVRIPQDISIIGFNNIRYASKTTPPLTTIDQPFTKIAEHAIQTLCARVEKKEPINTRKAPFSHKLITRNSTTNPSI